MKNALIVSVDDMIDVVRYRTAFGVELHTPAIDSLIERGVTFENAFTPVPLCNPARVATMTGRSPFTTGVHHNRDARIEELLPVEETLVGAAHAAGWHTGSRGKVFHLQPMSQKVQKYLNPALDDVDWTEGFRSTGNKLPSKLGASPVPESQTHDAITAVWTSTILRDPPKDKPFFLAIGFLRPHLSWDVPKTYYDLYDPDDIEVPKIDGVSYRDLPELFQNVLSYGTGTHDRIVDAGLWRAHVHGYLASISFADAQLAKVLKAMDDADRWDDTTVVLWSDHGYHLGDRDIWRKFTLWEEAASVPLVFVDPDVGEAGARVSTPVSLLDLWPTLSTLTGLPQPQHGDGMDLAGLMEDPDSGLPRGGVLTSAYGSVSIRTKNWRYVLYNDGEEELFRVDKGQVYGRDMLDRAEHPGRTARLRDKLEKELERLDVDLVDAGERARGDKDDDEFILIGDAKAVGRKGDDVYHVTERSRIIEWDEGGDDLAFVASSVRYVVPDHVETAVLTNAATGALVGNTGHNHLRGNRSENTLFGGRGHDTLEGDGSEDRLVGGFGRDVLFGGKGGDVLNGGRNDDTLRGGGGEDVLRGMRGSDVLAGGQNSRDRFDFEHRLDSRVGRRRDEIRDFENGLDVVDLTDIDAVAGGRANEAFTWIGRRGFSGEAGELRWHRKGEDVRLKGDVDGDGNADFAISFDDLDALWRGDVML